MSQTHKDALAQLFPLALGPEHEKDLAAEGAALDRVAARNADLQCRFSVTDDALADPSSVAAAPSAVSVASTATTARHAVGIRIGSPRGAPPPATPPTGPLWRLRGCAAEDAIERVLVVVVLGDREDSFTVGLQVQGHLDVDRHGDHPVVESSGRAKHDERAAFVHDDLGDFCADVSDAFVEDPVRLLRDRAAPPPPADGSVMMIVATDAPLSDFKREWIDRLLMRMEGVMQVSESKYIMLHAPRAALDEIRRLLPGSEAPTVIPLEGTNDKVAVHAVCRENVFWETLENLKAAGASSLLVLPVEKMLV